MEVDMKCTSAYHLRLKWVASEKNIQWNNERGQLAREFKISLRYLQRRIEGLSNSNPTAMRGLNGEEAGEEEEQTEVSERKRRGVFPEI